MNQRGRHQAPPVAPLSEGNVATTGPKRHEVKQLEHANPLQWVEQQKTGTGYRYQAKGCGCTLNR
jgi:hypothetical protein